MGPERAQPARRDPLEALSGAPLVPAQKQCAGAVVQRDQHVRLVRAPQRLQAARRLPEGARRGAVPAEGF